MTQPNSSPRPVPGGSGILANRSVARLGYGAMQLERLHDDRSAAIALLRRAFDLGVDHIDTAEFYGNGFVNEVIRHAIRPEDDVVIVSKVGADPNPGGPVALRPAQRPAELRSSVEANLRTLGVDRIEVVNLRRMDTGPGIRVNGDQAVPIEDQLETMIALRDEGKIGAIGLSSVTAESLITAIPAGIACVQNAYSFVSRENENLLEICSAHGIAWVPFFPLGSAFAGMPKVTEDATVLRVAHRLGVTPSAVGLAWLLRHASAILLIPGTADVAHLEANVAAGSLALDEASFAELNAAGDVTEDTTEGTAEDTVER